MNTIRNLICSIALICLFFNSCSETKMITSSDITASSPPITENKKIFIKDRTGKLWDITHAKNKYGFQPQFFQFGLGPFAIRPLMNPDMCHPGDEGFPIANANHPVIGVQIGNESHAYPLRILKSFEVVNTNINKQPVAPSY